MSVLATFTHSRRGMVVACSRSFSTVDGLVDHSTLIPMKFQGRSSVSGVTSTVFGSTGFLGRFVVSRLGRVGSRVLLPYRGDGMNTRHMKLMGDLGQINPIPFNMVEEDTVYESVKNSPLVVNLMGHDTPSSNYSLHDVNVKCVHRLCKAVEKAGVLKRFIHVSALGADPNSPSEFLRTKYEGEQVVKEFFPDAIIMRPAPMFGASAKWIDNIALSINRKYICPIIDGGEAKFQPVHVQDVAQAIINSIVSSDAPGLTYELVGPNVYTRKEAFEMIAREMATEDYGLVNIPTQLAEKAAWWFEKLMPYSSWRTFNTSSVYYEAVDIVASYSYNGLEDLKITPEAFETRIAFCMMEHTGLSDDYSFNVAQRGHMNSYTNNMLNAGKRSANTQLQQN